MSVRKTRLTVTVDIPWVKVGQAAVKDGRAASLSAWVNDALAAHAERDERRKALREAIAWYEREHGKFTEEEMARLEREREARTIRYVRGKRVNRKSA